MKTENQSIDEMINTFDISTTEPIGPVDWATFSLCIPKAYKAKFDSLQNASGKKFGKLLKKVLMTTIDKMHSDNSEEQNKAS
jgi:hypothetical protein